MDPLQEALEAKFLIISSELDDYLEEKFGNLFLLHPNRPVRGSGANPSYDGLFATTIAFTLGYGSKTGRGYLINIDIRTLQFVSSEIREEINTEAFFFVDSKLPEVFPERKLKVVREGKLLKIIGDFSLN